MIRLVCRKFCYFLDRCKKPEISCLLLPQCSYTYGGKNGILPLEGGILSSPEPKWMQVASTSALVDAPYTIRSGTGVNIMSLPFWQPKRNIHGIKVGV